MVESIERKVLAILPLEEEWTPLDKEEIIRLHKLYCELVGNYVGKEVKLSDLVEKVKKDLNCDETRTCKLLYGGHQELAREKMSTILELPESSEQASYQKLKEQSEIKESKGFEKNFTTFLYLKADIDGLYLGVFGLDRDESKPLDERKVNNKCDLIRIMFYQDT